MTPSPPDAPAADAVSVSLRDIRWERIQVILRLADAAALHADPASVHLTRTGNGPLSMAPTRAWIEGDEVVLRYNVMLGPGQMPLGPGAWRLTAPRADGARQPVHVRGSVPADASARFATRRGEYAVAPRLTADRSLELGVTLDPETRPERVVRTKPFWSPSRRRRKRWMRQGLQLLFNLSRKVTRRNGRRILFVSYMGTELSGNMKSVWDRMVERGLDREYELIKLTRQRLEGRSYRYLLRLPWVLAKADTIVYDAQNGALDRVVGLNARMIMLWHAATTIKTIGYSRIGKPRSLHPWSVTYKHINYAVANGDHDVPIFAEAFGIPEDRVKTTGHPRLDRFFDETYRAKAIEGALASFPEARGRKVILFAPTWRYELRDWRTPGTGPAGRSYPLEILDYARIHQLCVEKDAVFIIRLHPTVTRPLGIPEAFRDRILDGSTTVMDAPDLLFLVDLLITDYSSIVLEYSIQGRPVLLFPFDLEEYQADRDVYVPYEEFAPGRIVRTFDELEDAIRRDDYEAERVVPFAEKHFAHFDTGATDRVIDLILDDAKPIQIEDPYPDMEEE